MDEGYTGTKFSTVYRRRQAPHHPLSETLLGWCRRFAELGLAGKAMGNLSFRSGQEFIITPTGTDPLTLQTADLVEIETVDMTRCVIVASGLREPSSETMMHHAIYVARPDVGAVFHGHSAQVLDAAEKRGWPVTAREVPYGTPEMARNAVAVLGNHGFVILRNHGFIALGADMKEAGQRLENVINSLAI